MNDLILITVSAIGGGIVGALGMSWLTAAKVADLQNQRDHAIDAKVADILPLANLDIAQQAADAISAHTRCADALAAKNDRIDRALACVTENSAHVGKKMAAILKGER